MCFLVDDSLIVCEDVSIGSATGQQAKHLTGQIMDIIKQALQQYGAGLTDENFISRNDKVLSVQAVIKGKRLRFEGAGKLIASGPITAKFVESFVEQFWFWEKNK